jgi:nucleoid-associated protein YgaU
MAKPIALKAAGSGTLKRPDEASTGKAGGQDSMQRAVLTLYACEDAPGGAKTGASLGSLKFQFNPKEVTIAKGAKWERKPAKNGKSASPPEFTGTDPCKLTVEMFFDATTTHDGAVVEAVETLFSCLVATDKSHSKKKDAPPLVVLSWGKITSFNSFITSVSAKYTLFGSDGVPIRAVCSVAMEEMPGELFRQNPTSGSYDVRNVHRTIAGDTLAGIAYAEYGDPTLWRALAAYNGIDDPLRVRPGVTLMLPTPEELVA